MKNRILPFDWIVFGLLFLTSSLMLIGRKVGNLSFYSLTLIALVCLVLRTNHCGTHFIDFVRRFWKLHLAMAGLFIAVLLNQLISQDFAARSLDYPSRMAFFVLLVWASLICSAKMFHWLQWSYVLGAILATIKMYIITDGGTSRAQYVDRKSVV